MNANNICIHQAIGIVNDSGSAPAAYHLARHLEAVGRTVEAVSFYARSNRFNHAIRLAKDHGMDSEVVSMIQGMDPAVTMLCFLVIVGDNRSNTPSRFSLKPPGVASVS